MIFLSIYATLISNEHQTITLHLMKGFNTMNWRDRFSKFMMGRYGTDSLSKTLLITALVLYILNLFISHATVSQLFSTASLLLLILCYYRMFSRNVYKRANENQKFLYKTANIRRAFDTYKKQAKDMKTHHIYKCPNCKQKIRVPRGKGRISIHCPKCHTEFIKKS